MSQALTTKTFFDHMRRENQSFRLVGPGPAIDQTVLRGRFANLELRQGLSVHYSDVTHLCDLDAYSDLRPGLRIKFFLEGHVDANIGGLQLPMPYRREGLGPWIPSACAMVQRSTESFHRRSSLGDRIRKFKICIGPEWLESGDAFAGGTATALAEFATRNLSMITWQPSPAALSLASQAMNPPDQEPWLQRLYIESRVLGIIAEAFCMLRPDDAATLPAVLLRPAERRRLELAEDAIRANPDRVPSVAELAAAAGVSINTLQRLFRTAHGVPIVTHLRAAKLKQARMALETDGPTIAQAAHAAGYGSAANFSIAFKRQFGFSPKAARR